MSKGQATLRIASVSKLQMGESATVPLYLCCVSAGFLSPAGDYVEKNIDLNDWLIRNKLATYIVRVEGDSMIGEIHPDDRLIVDRSLEPRHKDVVIAQCGVRYRRGADCSFTQPEEDVDLPDGRRMAEWCAHCSAVSLCFDGCELKEILASLT